MIENIGKQQCDYIFKEVLDKVNSDEDSDIKEIYNTYLTLLSREARLICTYHR